MVTFKNVVGENFKAEVPKFIEHYYRGTLLSKILHMPKKNALTFDDAVRMAGRKHLDATKVGHVPGESHWFLSHFVEWISELGFHIELNGDEFEASAMSDKIA